jgi:phosphoserine phosphatase
MSEQPKSSCVCLGAGPEISQWLRRMGPGEAAESHFKAARVEFLKGLRAIIDRKIEDLSKSETKGTKVSVE